MHRVLVIDTEPDTGEAIRQLGNGELYSVEEVERGDKGLSIASESKPSAIILNADIHAGFTYCRRIRRHQDLSNIPLVLVSAKASEEQFQEHKRLPTHADLYLHKPFDVQALEELLASLFQTEGNGHNKAVEPAKSPKEAVATPVAPSTDSTKDKEAEAREQQSMKLLARELQELREAYAKLLEEHDRGTGPHRGASDVPDKDTAEMNKQVSELLQQCAILEGEKSNLTERIASLNSEVETLQARNAEDESLQAGFETEIAQYETQLMEKDTLIQQLRDELQQNSASNVDFEESIQAVDEALQAACRVVAELRNPDSVSVEDGNGDAVDASDLAVEF